MANKKSKPQTTMQRIGPWYMLIIAVTIAIGSLLVFLISFAIIESYIGNTGGIVGGLIIALLFALVVIYSFLTRSWSRRETGRTR
ncbi:MAG TPA: hypothetical protein VGJ92_00885 [Methanocella sp.]|jgi:uncharacterized membrane protein